jgi:hypothetical protein
LPVFSLSMMVQIVEHRAETSTDFLVEEEVVSSMPQVPNHPVPGTTAVHAARQHTATQTSRTPSRAAPGALLAARELLRHPPSSTASPGAMKQWRDDIDRLLGMVHSTSTRSRSRSSRRPHKVSASVRSPSVRDAQTNDLQAELNRRRVGEDARISLEWARERRQNIKGCNLDQDFAAVAPQAPMGTRSQAGVPLAGVGCAALADHLRVASWPPKFRPHLAEKYDGTSNPSEFLQVYVTAITAAGGNTAVMATYFHIALSGLAWTWLMNLAPGVNLLLGRALCTVRCELCQCLPAARCGGPPPCGEAGSRGDPPDVHLPLHQNVRYYTSHFRCFHHHGLSSGSTL